MKKLMIAGAVALTAAASMVSCSKSESTTTADNASVSTEIADSVAMYYGRAFGANIYGYLTNMEERSGEKMNKGELLKGVQYGVGASESNDFVTGMKIGMHIKNFIEENRKNGIDISAEVVMKNFRSVVNADSLDGARSQLDYAEFSTLMNRVRRIQMEQQEAEMAKKAEAGLKDGAAYVEKAKSADSSIQTSESGLSYKIENAGTDPKVGANDAAVVKYTGKLIDGTVFDSGEAEFTPGRVVAGFGEGMQLLGKGGKATLYIPGNLGYGASGAGDKIGPNATLIFDIEIIDINRDAVK